MTPDISELEAQYSLAQSLAASIKRQLDAAKRANKAPKVTRPNRWIEKQLRNQFKGNNQ